MNLVNQTLIAPDRNADSGDPERRGSARGSCAMDGAAQVGVAARRRRGPPKIHENFYFPDSCDFKALRAT
jgi:hypothetical protein